MVGKRAIFRRGWNVPIEMLPSQRNFLELFVEAQGNFLYHLNLEINHDHEKLTLSIKGILCNQLLHLIESDIQFYLDLIA